MLNKLNTIYYIPSMSLFRIEAIEAKRGELLGQVTLLRPVSFAFLAAFASVCIGLILSFLFFGEYTKRAQVSGLLVPDRGLIKVVPPQPGVVIERRVKEGQAVRKGDVLYVLSSERITDINETGSQIGTNAAILQTVQARRELLKTELAQQSYLSIQQREKLARTVNELKAEISQTDNEISIQNARIASAQFQYQRHRSLADKHFLSELAMQQKHDELLDQQGRLQALQRNRLTTSRELSSTQSELAQLSTRSKREQAQISRMASELEQMSISTEAQQRLLVTAPQDGTVTAILAEPGQTVSNQALLTLVPANTQLKAELYAPSRAVGFIEAGQRVLIRYAAYPYQKFGQYEGTVIAVSRTALLPQEVPAQIPNGTLLGGSEGLYRIIVELSAQSAIAYGKAQPLAAGMALDADVLQDTRTLIEWVLEPLYSLKGKA